MFLPVDDVDYFVECGRSRSEYPVALYRREGDQADRRPEAIATMPLHHA